MVHPHMSALEASLWFAASGGGRSGCAKYAVLVEPSFQTASRQVQPGGKQARLPRSAPPLAKVFGLPQPVLRGDSDQSDPCADGQ